MPAEMRTYVIGLLESCRKRMNQIALLHYELEHPANVSPDEIIEAMSLYRSDGGSSGKGHISNKTLYIALNYQERTERLNSESQDEIVDRLIELEREQERLVYYIDLLNDERQETILRLYYFEGCAWSEIARELHIAARTVHKIKNRALDRLAEMYSFAEGPQKR